MYGVVFTINLLIVIGENIPAGPCDRSRTFHEVLSTDHKWTLIENTKQSGYDYFLLVLRKVKLFVSLFLSGYDDLSQSHDFGKSGYHTSVSPSQNKSNAGL